MTHICIGNLTIIGPDNGLSPGRRQAIIWTNAGILLIGPWGTNFSEISIGIQAFSLKKMHLRMSSEKMASILSWPQCVNVGLSIVHILISLKLYKINYFQNKGGIPIYPPDACKLFQLSREDANHLVLNRHQAKKLTQGWFLWPLCCITISVNKFIVKSKSQAWKMPHNSPAWVTYGMSFLRSHSNQTHSVKPLI